jgi:hypothetical protein
MNHKQGRLCIFFNKINFSWYQPQAILSVLSDLYNLYNCIIFRLNSFVCTPSMAYICHAYTSSAGTNTQVFSGNSGSFNVYPLSNFSGSFVIQASAIADAFCACP